MTGCGEGNHIGITVDLKPMFAGYRPTLYFNMAFTINEHALTRTATLQNERNSATRIEKLKTYPHVRLSVWILIPAAPFFLVYNGSLDP